MRARGCHRGVAVAVGLLAACSAPKTVRATREDGDSWQKFYPHTPCIISVGNNDRIAGRWTPDPSCGLRLGAGRPSRYKCFECVPVTDDLGDRYFFEVGRAGRENPVLMTPRGLESKLRESSVEQAVLEGPLQKMQELVGEGEAAWTGTGVESNKYREPTFAAYSTRAIVAVSKEEEVDGNGQDDLVDAAGDIVAGILAALAAAAAAVAASVASDSPKESSGLFVPSLETASEDTLATGEGRLDPPPGVRASEPGVQTVQEAARLRGTGAKVHGESLPDSAPSGDDTAENLGVSFGEKLVAKIARRKLQVETPTPTPETPVPPTPTPGTTTTEPSSPQTPAPETLVPEAPTPEPSTPETPAPPTPFPETTTPETLAPQTSAPSTPAPEAPTTEPSGPETLTPSTPTTETPIPATPAPRTFAPGSPAPSTPAPRTFAPGTPAPSTPAPGTLAPGTLAPGSPAPGTLAPGTLAPGSSAPGTLAPGTLAPGSPAPGTLAPGTLAPGSPAPETLAPGTLAPGSPAPAAFVPTLVNTPVPAPTELSTSSPTLVDGFTVFPTSTTEPTPTPGSTHTPIAAPTASTSTDDLIEISSPAPVLTPAPIGNVSSTEKALETTGEVASSAVTVGVAATAAAATVTTVTVVTTTATVTATTATTTAATTSTVASAVTSTATTVATTGSGAGTSSTGASAAGGAASGAGAGNTTTAAHTGAQMTTPTNAGGGAQETVRTGAQSTQSNTTTSNTTKLATEQNSVSSRSPSTSLGLLMIFQMQFVSLLRLLEANITDPFMKFLDSLKWLNLHFDVDLNFFNCDDEDVQFTWSNGDDETWALNTFMVFGCLILLIITHILILSYLEASWLAQAVAPVDDNNIAAYERYLDAQSQDRELYEQEKLSAERYLRRHNSVWLYFPHMELLFLLFVYQGAASSEARLIYSGCFPLMVMGICALVVFPVLMFIYVSRIVLNRLRPSSSPLVFQPRPNGERGCWLWAPFCVICKAWKEGESIFAWADKGDWVSRSDEDVDLDSRKFRIGFEPLFVDYTQRGTLYMSFVLFEWLVFGLVCGLVTDGTIQTGIVVFIYVIDLLLLICLRPFSNSIIQYITTMTVLADTLTLVLMCYASLLDEDKDDDSEQLDYIYAGALIIQTVTIIFFVVPLYIDSFVTISSLLWTKLMNICKRKEKPAKPPIKGSCGEIAWIFCALVRENSMTCVKSTWRGPSYKPARHAELQRRQNTLLRPISENAPEDGITYSYRELMAQQGRIRVNNFPVARHPH